MSGLQEIHKVFHASRKNVFPERVEDISSRHHRWVTTSAASKWNWRSLRGPEEPCETPDGQQESNREYRIRITSSSTTGPTRVGLNDRFYVK